jgi:chorismate mutase-like protein
MADIDDLRARIDQLDGALIAIVAERLAVCRQVASVKEGSDTPVIQPGRVRDVVETRRQQAIDAGVDPDFVEQLFRVLLTETHRIEVAGHRPDAAPEKPATTGESRSGLDTVASRVDHIVVAVDDLDLATTALQSRFGFRQVAMAGGARPGICTLAAGGVTLVIVGPHASPSVAEYLDGTRSSSIAIECSTPDRPPCSPMPGTVADRRPRRCRRHEQFFAVTEPAAGFSSASSHERAIVLVSARNVLALFDAIRTTSP